MKYSFMPDWSRVGLVGIGLAIMAIALLAVAGCTQPTVVGCLPVAPYPPAFQHQASAELKVLSALEALPSDSALRGSIDAYLTTTTTAQHDLKLPISRTPSLNRMADDYLKMRDEARACAR